MRVQRDLRARGQPEEAEGDALVGVDRVHADGPRPVGGDGGIGAVLALDRRHALVVEAKVLGGARRVGRGGWRDKQRGRALIHS